MLGGVFIFKVTRLDFLIIMIIIILYLNRNILIEIINKKKYINNDRLKASFIKLIFKLYMISLIAVVYFPITIAWGENKINKMPKIYLSPIQSIIKMYKNKGLFHVIENIGGNLILLAPLAFFLCYYFEKIFNNKRNIVIITLFISLFIECSQVTLSVIVPNFTRVFDVNDLICNTISGLIGYKLYLAYIEINNKIN